MPKSRFQTYAFACTCDPDRIVQDKFSKLYCGSCMEPMDQFKSYELEASDQEEIMVKLSLQNKISHRQKTRSE